MYINNGTKIWEHPLMMKEGMPSEFIPLYALMPLIVALTSSAEMGDAVVFFDVLLTVHLSIILAINQLNAQNLLL